VEIRQLIKRLLLIIFISCAPAFADNSIRITPSTLPTGDDPGFSCAFWRASEKNPSRYILFADDDILLPRRALITVNGKSVVLAPKDIKRRVKSKNRFSVGDEYVFSFEAEGVQVTTTATVTWACPRNNDSCEVTRYRAKILVEANGGSTSIDARGECGN
jgi:hypothetical protein